MKARLRLVALTIWAASRGPLTRYGRTPREAYDRLVAAERDHGQTIFERISELVDSGDLRPVRFDFL